MLLLDTGRAFTYNDAHNEFRMRVAGKRNVLRASLCGYGLEASGILDLTDLRSGMVCRFRLFDTKPEYVTAVRAVRVRAGTPVDPNATYVSGRPPTRVEFKAYTKPTWFNSRRFIGTNPIWASTPETVTRWIMRRRKFVSFLSQLGNIRGAVKRYDPYGTPARMNNECWPVTGRAWLAIDIIPVGQ